jgi:hypothetical protein
MLRLSKVNLLGCAVSMFTIIACTAANAYVVKPAAQTGPGFNVSDRLVVGHGTPQGQVIDGFRDITDTQKTNCGPANGDTFTTGVSVLGGCAFSVDIPAPLDLSLVDKFTLVYEPDGTTVSDLFGITCGSDTSNGQACTSAYWIFLSTIPGQTLDFTGFSTTGFFTETEIPGGTGTVFDATRYIAPQFQGNYFARFSSANEEIPEPATLTLVGAGIAAVATMRRRRKANARA